MTLRLRLANLLRRHADRLDPAEPAHRRYGLQQIQHLAAHIDPRGRNDHQLIERIETLAADLQEPRA